jgi:hypothetical protein
MAGKLSSALRRRRQWSRHEENIPALKIERPPLREHPHDQDTLSQLVTKTQLRNPERRGVYKKELQNLARYGTRTEGKTIFFAHPLQTSTSIRRRGRFIVRERVPLGVQGGAGTHSLIETYPSVPRRRLEESGARGAAMREMIKARRYSKLVKKLSKKGGKLGMAGLLVGTLIGDE